MNAPVFSNHGCRLNMYETEAMKELVNQSGLTDTVVVNTCAVTAEAVRKAKQDIRKLRRTHPQAKLIVTGCAAQTEPESFAQMSEVDVYWAIRKKCSLQLGPAWQESMAQSRCRWMTSCPLPKQQAI